MNTQVEIKIIDYKISDGAPASVGDTITVNYKVAKSFEDIDKGILFDNSWEKKPIEFILGNGEVLKGIDIGLDGMRIASTRRLIIHHSLAFGAIGVPGLILPNTTLFFEIYLLKIEKAKPSSKTENIKSN